MPNSTVVFPPHASCLLFSSEFCRLDNPECLHAVEVQRLYVLPHCSHKSQNNIEASFLWNWHFFLNFPDVNEAGKEERHGRHLLGGDGVIKTIRKI